MPIVQVDLEKVKDNPYQPRKGYSQKKIDEIASSIEQNGLLETPLGRRTNGDVELAFGHLRKRAFIKLKKRHPKKWLTMPVDIREMTDQDMVVFALEENLKRSDITPIDLARSVSQYLDVFPEVSETALATKLSMTQGHVSNMRRVMRLPDEILQKIDEGRITFTMGRELLIFENLTAPGKESRYSSKEKRNIEIPKDSKWLMLAAIKGIATPGSEGRYGSHPCSVDGMQKAIHDVAKGQFRPLGTTPDYGYNREEVLFNTSKAGCKSCEKAIKTHTTKSATSWCTDEKCWERHQKVHREQRAAEAKKKMQADILAKATAAEAERQAKPISQEIPAKAEPLYTLAKRGTGWIALDKTGLVIAMAHDKEQANTRAIDYFKPVATVVNPGAEDYRLNHTYRISLKPNRRPEDFIFDYTAQDLTAAVAAAGVSTEDIESVKVWKSSGKLGTAGDVSAGWSKCEEPMEKPSQAAAAAPAEDIVDTIPEEEREHARERIKQLGKGHPNYPCLTCLSVGHCDGTGVYAVSGVGESEVFACDNHMGKGDAKKVREKATLKVPAEVLALAREKAGSRAAVLDLNELRAGSYGDLKAGYVQLDNIMDRLDNPQECLETCTRGFHYAFDSKERPSWAEEHEARVLCVCTDPKCVTKKKAAHTRAINAAGQAKKNAEHSAIKQAVGATTRLDHLRMKIVVFCIMSDDRSYYSSANSAVTWWTKKLKIETTGYSDTSKLRVEVIKKLDACSEEELARHLLEYSLMKMSFSGDIARYKVQTTEFLNWLGVGVQVDKNEPGPAPERG